MFILNIYKNRFRRLKIGYRLAKAGLNKLLIITNKILLNYFRHSCLLFTGSVPHINCLLVIVP